MFVCLSLVGGRGRSNFCDVNCARRYSAIQCKIQADRQLHHAIYHFIVTSLWRNLCKAFKNRFSSNSAAESPFGGYKNYRFLT